MGNLLGAILVGAVAILSLVVILLARGRRSILAFLVGAAAGLFAVQVAQVHFFTIVVVIWALFAGNNSQRGLVRESIVVLLCVAPLSVTALTGDLVNSPTLALQLLAFAMSSALLLFRASPSDIRQMLYGLLTACTVGSTLAILQVAGIAPVSAATLHLTVSALGRPTGIYPEPDWLGMFAAIGLILTWRLRLRASVRIVLVVLNAFALIFSFARAAWVSLAVAAAVGVGVAILDRSRSRKAPTPPGQFRRKSGRPASIFFLVASGGVVLAVIPSLAADLATRLSRTLVADPNDVSAQARVQQNDGLNYLASTAPWYGHGISASGRVGVSGILDYGETVNNVGSNWLLSLWVDGQLLAIPMIVLFLFTALRASRFIEGQLLIVVLLSSLFSNATYQPIAWFLIAACLAQSRWRSISSRDEGYVNTMETRLWGPVTTNLSVMSRNRLEKPAPSR